MGLLLRTPRPAAALITDTPATPGGALWYVSKLGSNADGRSWATAWNELNQIVWASVNPGDTLLLDGGSSSNPSPFNASSTTPFDFAATRPNVSGLGMVYTTPMTVGKSGSAGLPITVKLSRVAGSSGQAVFFGGRTASLPSINQSSYTYVTAGVQASMLVVNGQSFVTIDGRKRSGILLYGVNGRGVDYQANTNANLILRNMEIFDNGVATQGNVNDSFASPPTHDSSFSATNTDGATNVANNTFTSALANFNVSVVGLTLQVGSAYRTITARPSTTTLTYDGASFGTLSAQTYFVGYVRDWWTDGWNIALRGNVLTFDRCLLHDAGQDPIQTRGTTTAQNHLTYSNCAFYNSREAINYPGYPFCQGTRQVGTHSDSIQLFGGGLNQDTIVFDHCLFGPFLGQGLNITNGNTDNWQNVTIQHCLFLQTMYDAINAGGGGTATLLNWLIDHCTFQRFQQGGPAGEPGNSVIDGLKGATCSITNSLFQNSGLTLDGTVTGSGNYYVNSAAPPGGTNRDPLFVAGTLSGMTAHFSEYAALNLTPTDATIVAAGAGAQITSFAALLARIDSLNS